MLQSVKKLAGVLLLLGGLNQAHAFSLQGPPADWQVFEIGYFPDADVGGALNLGEEYRWNSPTLIYGFDNTFLEYFGDEGIKAVRNAIAILNAVPAASQMSADLSEFPLDTRRINYQASALGIWDLKSFVLSALLEEVGLASSDRFVWTLRSRVVIGETPFYTVIQRNFDPVTLRPTPYVNGTLYSYQIQQTYAQPDAWEPVEVSVDPLAPTVTAVTALSGIGGGFPDLRGISTLAAPGMFYTGLTRDDIGGLRYLYRRSNQNVETLPTNIVSNFGAPSSGGGGSPWQPVPNPGTVNTNTPGTGVTNNNFVNIALRPGVEKLQFVEATFDSVLGQFFTNSVTYTDQFITNGTVRRQTVTRGLIYPDIIFSAADLGVDAAGIPNVFSRTGAESWIDNSGIQNSGVVTGVDGIPAAGPGTIEGTIRITFSNILPYFRNSGEGGTEETATRSMAWGSFDASTNAPVVYPVGTTIEQLEGAIRTQSGGGSGFSPWRLP